MNLYEYLKAYFSKECRAALGRCQDELQIPLPPSYQEEITGGELRNLLYEATGCTNIILADAVYKITSVPELKRFIRHVGIYKMVWRTDAPDCDDFTRKLKGELVCDKWWWQPALDVWWNHPAGLHSEFMTVLLDENGEREVYLIEPQAAEMFEIGREMFEDNAPYVIKQ